MATDLAQQAGERANAVASWLEEREPGHVVDEITRFARQRPGAFLPSPPVLVSWLAVLAAVSKTATTAATTAHPRVGNTPNPRIADTSPQGYASVPQPPVPPRPHRATTPADINPHPATNSHAAPATRRRHRVTRGVPVGGIWRRERSLRRAPGRPRRAAPSLGELFGEVSNDLSELVRQELALAKAEATQTATRAGKGVGMFAGAALGGYFVLLFLSVAGWWGLGDAIGHAWSALVVMLVWAVIAAVLAMMGRTAFAAAKGLPQTTDTVKRIPDALSPNPEETR